MKTPVMPKQTLTARVAALEAQLAALTAPRAITPPDDPAALIVNSHYGDPMTHTEPFDAKLVLTRNEPGVFSSYHMTGIIAMIQEEHQEWSVPAPLYIEVWSTDHPQANQGQLTTMSTGVYLRTYTRGNNWVGAYAVDLVHLGPEGTSIGVDVEAKRHDAGGTVIGFCAHNGGESSAPGDIAYFVNGAGNTGWKKALVRSDPGAMLTVGSTDYVTVRDDMAAIWGPHPGIGNFATDEAGATYLGPIVDAAGHRAVHINADGTVVIYGRFITNE